MHQKSADTVRLKRPNNPERKKDNGHGRGHVEISITAASNRVLQTHILGLYYFDAATGQSALLGAVHDSIGELLPPNQIIYHNAFGGCTGDVRFTFSRAGFESDVILLAAPPNRLASSATANTQRDIAKMISTWMGRNISCGLTIFVPASSREANRRDRKHREHRNYNTTSALVHMQRLKTRLIDRRRKRRAAATIALKFSQTA